MEVALFKTWWGHDGPLPEAISLAREAGFAGIEAPEFKDALSAHERWWDVVWDSMASRNLPRVTMTPEFGPDGYLQCEPFSRKPVADLWELNRWIGWRQKKRFEDRFQIPPTQSKHHEHHPQP